MMINIKGLWKYEDVLAENKLLKTQMDITKDENCRQSVYVQQLKKELVTVDGGHRKMEDALSHVVDSLHDKLTKKEERFRKAQEAWQKEREALRADHAIKWEFYAYGGYVAWLPKEGTLEQIITHTSLPVPAVKQLCDAGVTYEQLCALQAKMRSKRGEKYHGIFQEDCQAAGMGSQEADPEGWQAGEESGCARLLSGRKGGEG